MKEIISYWAGKIKQKRYNRVLSRKDEARKISYWAGKIKQKRYNIVLSRKDKTIERYNLSIEQERLNKKDLLLIWKDKTRKI